MSKKRKRKKSLLKLIIVIIPLILLIKGIEKNLEVQKSKNIQGVFNINKSNQIMIVNRENAIDSNFEPEDLVFIDVESNKDILARNEVSEALKRLFDKALIAGYELMVVSGYRSYQYQEDVYNESLYTEGVEYTEKYVAKPGYSEHQTGLAVDVVSINYPYLDTGFENTDEFNWLKENISDYGFIIRYPKNKEEITGYSYEPWHLRYVGKELAKEIEKSNLTLEEYLFR